eukprot:5427935-Alexandrium_andersonii.AAC.1
MVSLARCPVPLRRPFRLHAGFRDHGGSPWPVSSSKSCGTASKCARNLCGCRKPSTCSMK